MLAGSTGRSSKEDMPEPSAGEKPNVQIVLRPYASAIPLASFAFGIGNILYSAFLLHWIPSKEAHSLAVILLAFVAPLELFPSVLAYLSRDTGGATAFATFGAAWVVQGLNLLMADSQLPSATDGFFLIGLALVLGIVSAISFAGKPLLGGLLLVAVLRTVSAAMLSFGLHGAWPMLTAIAGLVLATMAFYSALAFLLEDVRQEISPLTFRTGDAKAAMEGKFEDQVDALTREAGVRKQL